ncbi:integral membrane protein [Ophiocordyceps camponoti-floridani]|uniref:Integral membrane protein n=1 Tax=Ophiocordyceps camponoti-floridani TaxID=2030778 RepID=A0A8H4VF59_9HYPO|nr:integral membrane protein [Ophiocordyceps camponoti-floridani]
MNVVHPSQAPPEYQSVAWIADTCKLLMGLGWTVNYIGMISKSLRQKTYAMSLMALCCNFAWEATYALVYPFGTRLEKWVHYSGLLLNCGVMYTAVRHAPGEWAHAPLVQRNLRLIFVLCVAGCMSAHLALAVQLGPRLAQAWSAYGYVLRYRYWRKDHEWMASPLYIWFVCTFLVLDGSYGLCLWLVRRFESEQQTAKAPSLKRN